MSLPPGLVDGTPVSTGYADFLGFGLERRLYLGQFWQAVDADHDFNGWTWKRAVGVDAFDSPMADATAEGFEEVELFDHAEMADIGDEIGDARFEVLGRIGCIGLESLTGSLGAGFVMGFSHSRLQKRKRPAGEGRPFAGCWEVPGGRSSLFRPLVHFFPATLFLFFRPGRGRKPWTGGLKFRGWRSVQHVGEAEVGEALDDVFAAHTVDRGLVAALFVPLIGFGDLIDEFLVGLASDDGDIAFGVANELARDRVDPVTVIGSVLPGIELRPAIFEVAEPEIESVAGRSRVEVRDGLHDGLRLGWLGSAVGRDSAPSMRAKKARPAIGAGRAGRKDYSAAWSCSSSRKAGSGELEVSSRAAGCAQRLGQPAGAGKQTFGFERHLLLLEIGQELRGFVALGFAHRLDDLRLGDAVQIIVSARDPAGLRHVELQRGRKLVRMTPLAGNPDMGLVDGVDGEAGAMGEERLAAIGIEAREPVPEFLRTFGQSLLPAAVTCRDRFGGGRIGKARKGRGEIVLGLDLQAGVAGVVVKQAKRQRVQHREIRHAGIVGERLAERQRTIGGELDHQPVGKCCIVVLVIAGYVLGAGRSGTIEPGIIPVRGIARIAADTLPGGLVLAPDIAALDQESAVVAKADKGAGFRFLRLVEDGRFVLICGEELLHSLKPVFGFWR